MVAFVHLTEEDDKAVIESALKGCCCLCCDDYRLDLCPKCACCKSCGCQRWCLERER